MAKRIDEIWAEAPGLPKAVFLGGLALYAAGHVLSWFGDAWLWARIYRTALSLGGLMAWTGMALCAAALLGGGLAAPKD